MAEQDIRKGSEYGGVPGRIQPSPHDSADHPSEILGLIYKTNEDGVAAPGGYVPDDRDPAIPQTPQIRR